MNDNCLRRVMLLLLCLVLPVFCAQAQTIASKPYENQSEAYLAITAVGKTFSLKWKVEVDFGQALQISLRNKDLLRDEKGEVISFDSPIDALNYLNSQGWELVTASADEGYFYAIMRRKT